jgi:periplasmic divalent cation tolerance protein
VRGSRAEFVQMQVAVPSAAVGTRLARGLVGSRLAACVQIVGPVQSHYRWQGRIERGREWLLLIKTRAALLPDLEAAVRRAHPYTLPEMLVVAIEGGFPPYLDWVRRECSPGRPRQRALPARPEARLRPRRVGRSSTGSRSRRGRAT